MLFPTLSFAKAACNIFIHGYTSENHGYFGEMPRQVLWDSSKVVEDSAPEVAKGILEQMSTCPKGSLITLRPHSYGAAQVLFILGQGRRFQDKYPYHDFVKIYKSTFEVYSYTGAYHGTPLMDLICSNKQTSNLGSLAGKPCVKTLLTSKIHSVSAFVSNPGVPTHLIFSTNRGGYLGLPGRIIAGSGISFVDYYFNNIVNQNDNTLPLASTKACSKYEVISNKDKKCKKLNGQFFFNFHHEKKYSHTEFLKNKNFMLMGNR